jgi:hypothetical protein
MSLKSHFSHSHLGFAPNVGAVSDENQERFQQDISTMEKRYAGKWSQHTLAACCWNCTEQVLIASYKRMSYMKQF